MNLRIKFIYCCFITTTLIASFQRAHATASSPRFTRVIYIVLENEDSQDVMKNNEFKNWSLQGANFTNFFAETHPSQPNYIAMIAGDTLGVKSNDNVNLNEKHLGDLLEEKGMDWRVYAEDYPDRCFLGATSGSYARKHVPFLSFKNVQKDSKRCARVTNFKSLLNDWKKNNLAAFNMVIPNNKNNGHDTNIAYSAQWLKKTFNLIFKNPQMMKDTLVVLTYDEGSYTLKNQIYTVFLGSNIIPGSTNNDKHTHYSLIRLIEEEWSLNSLGKGDSAASSILHIWR